MTLNINKYDQGLTNGKKNPFIYQFLGEEIVLNFLKLLSRNEWLSMYVIQDNETFTIIVDILFK